jgi:tripartite-type tricarboxylate transporter receptor subunit TctC
MYRRDVLGLAAIGVFGRSVQAQAPSYPNKPVRVVVAFTAGGTTDILARAVSQKLAESLKQPFVIDTAGGGRQSRHGVRRALARRLHPIVNSVGRWR